MMELKTWLWMCDNSLRCQLQMWTESVAFGHSQPKAGAIGTKGWESGDRQLSPSAEEGQQDPWGLRGVRVTETHKIWSDIYWGGGAGSPPCSTFRPIGFRYGTRAAQEGRRTGPVDGHRSVRRSSFLGPGGCRGRAICGSNVGGTATCEPRTGA